MMFDKTMETNPVHLMESKEKASGDTPDETAGDLIWLPSDTSLQASDSDLD